MSRNNPWRTERLYLAEFERDVVDFVTIAHVQFYFLYVWSWKSGKLKCVAKAVDRRDWDNAHPVEQGWTWSKMSREWRRRYADVAPKDRYFVVRLSPTRGKRSSRGLGYSSGGARSVDQSF